MCCYNRQKILLWGLPDELSNTHSTCWFIVKDSGIELMTNTNLFFFFLKRKNIKTYKQNALDDSLNYTNCMHLTLNSWFSESSRDPSNTTFFGKYLLKFWGVVVQFAKKGSPQVNYYNSSDLGFWRGLFRARVGMGVPGWKKRERIGDWNCVLWKAK